MLGAVASPDASAVPAATPRGGAASTGTSSAGASATGASGDGGVSSTGVSGAGSAGAGSAGGHGMPVSTHTNPAVKDAVTDRSG